MVWCSTADIALLDRVVRGASFPAGGVLKCNFFHQRSVRFMFVLYQIHSNLVHPLCGALPVKFVYVRAGVGLIILQNDLNNKSLL